MKNLIFFLFLISFTFSHSQNRSSKYIKMRYSFGIFENQLSVGKPKFKGTVSYDTEKQEYTIIGAGTNMWFDNDEFQYLYKSIEGDFILRARVQFVDAGSNPHRKIGWIVRNNLSSGSTHVNATVHGDGLTSLQYRMKDGENTEEVTSSDAAPDVIQLERRGSTFIMSTAKFGEPFTTVQIENRNIKKEVFVGLYVCSHNPDMIEKARFKNVRIIKTTPSDFEPYEDYLGSNLEIMDVVTGNRKVLYHSAHSLQAPNWVDDDKVLVYNSNGFLYRYRFRTEEVKQINTGFAVHNNNDHVFSFDEKILGISNHNQGDNGHSSIFIMNPLGDSNPKKITRFGVGASYLHGFSPDNTTLLFTGHRNGKYDIYSINIETREEFRLTDTDGLDDGSEFSPDGNYIYFNSNRTGSMKLWRMRPDGGNPEQLTFDNNYKDWFPHVSPDGKWIVFISFPPEVPFGEHPFYKKCTLRIMPTHGGTPKIIAYIYGGQGTINVPSWSKDSKRIAFVTNSD